jgi:hypothetical protein
MRLTFPRAGDQEPLQSGSGSVETTVFRRLSGGFVPGGAFQIAFRFLLMNAYDFSISDGASSRRRPPESAMVIFRKKENGADD